MYKIATWNVNSIKVRLEQVIQWLAQQQPDVLAIQETKIIDSQFPTQQFQQAGYQVVYAGQPTYNGVAIISKSPAVDIVVDFPSNADSQRRLLAATIDQIRFLNVYIPNGQELTSDKFQYKLNWIQQLHALIELQLQDYPELVILGDFNIAPEDRDVCEPAVWHDQVLVSEPERAAFQSLLNLGITDSFRLFNQAEAQFSWWDYRAGAFRRNWGLRIDHILLSLPLAPQCRKSFIDKIPRSLERPSDHTPVIVELER